jgi:hypothetical protein
MRNGIKSIYDYNGHERYEQRRETCSKVTFLEPCFPKLYAPDRDSRYWRLCWREDIPTEEEISAKQWCLLYTNNIYQIITLEDGTEIIVAGEHRAEGIQQLQEYINNGYNTASEMSRAAQLLDDEMTYEI